MYYNLHTHIIPKRKQENVCSLINLPIEEIHKIAPQNKNTDNYSIGLHPWKVDIENLRENINLIEKYSGFPTIKAIGECGLDRLCQTDFDLQKKAFLSQILISEKVNKPLIIHCVKAFDEMIVLKKKMEPKQAWVIHGFRGKPEQAQQLTKLGFYLSFGINYNAESIKKIPIEKIFLETDDSNYDIQNVYEKTAAILEIPEEKLVRQIEQNVKSNFSLSMPH